MGTGTGTMPELAQTIPEPEPEPAQTQLRVRAKSWPARFAAQASGGSFHRADKVALVPLVRPSQTRHAASPRIKSHSQTIISRINFSSRVRFLSHQQQPLQHQIVHDARRHTEEFLIKVWLQYPCRPATQYHRRAVVVKQSILPLY